MSLLESYIKSISNKKICSLAYLHTNSLLPRLFCLLSHSALAIHSASFSQVSLNLKWCVRKTVTLLLVIWWVVLRPDIMTFSRDLEGREWREGGGWVKYGLDIKNQSRIPMISAWNCPRICGFKWLRGLYFTQCCILIGFCSAVEEK